MKKQCKPWVFITSTLITILNFLCFISIRSMWSGIIRYTAEPVPYLLFAMLSVFTLCHTLLAVSKKHPLICIAFSWIVNIIFLILNCFIISLTLDASMYFIREFLYSAAFFLNIAVLYFLIVHLPKFSIWNIKYFSAIIFLLLLTFNLFLKFDFNFKGGVDGTPVVYAVENDYQIVIKTHSKGSTWITINSLEYNDTYAGYQKTGETIHKFIIPAAVLDNCKEYTVSTRSMILRGPYSALQGKVHQQTYQWRGSNAEDGLNYYVLSDTHNTQKCPAAAGSYFGDSLDFLISCGDTASWLDREEDLTQMHQLASSITQGQVPVIYARGNHETKGLRAHEYHNYVGSDDGNFYYTFRIKNVWGVVLDIGEDHRDLHPEYYGTARFNAYRKAQTEFLDHILENAETEFDAAGVDYRIAVCHIPLNVKYVNDHAGAYKYAWISRLNQMKLTILFGGHVHQLWYIDPNFEEESVLTLSPHYSGKATANPSRIMTNANFPEILVSRRSQGQLLSYPEYVFDKGFWGLAVSSDGSHTTMKYTNHNHEILENITSPWFKDINYGNQITIENVK